MKFCSNVPNIYVALNNTFPGLAQLSSAIQADNGDTASARDVQVIILTPNIQLLKVNESGCTNAQIVHKAVVDGCGLLRAVF